jgi:hypothetical protein
MIALGRLQRVEVRSVWLSEPQGFTPWLAREENLSLLAQTIGMSLELEAQEQSVGPFRADILCKNVEDGSWVLIENQLERTDHLHLGQLLTYAAGLDAVTIVWIAGSFTEEHRAALDWLNRITAEHFRFFGLEVELWRIADSPAAPKFNVIAKPNDWSRSTGRAIRTLTAAAEDQRAAKYLPYWTALQQFLASRRSPVQLTTLLAKHAVHFGIGRARFRLAAFGSWRSKLIGVALFIKDRPDKSLFRALREQRESIEAELGFAMDWQELPGQQRSRIEIRKRDADPTVEADWPAQHSWLAERLEVLERVFRPRLASLSAVDETIDSEDLELAELS